MKLFLILFFTLFEVAYAKNCLTDHVRDAIALNKERKDFYQIEAGRSEKRLFSFFIFFEKVMLPFSKSLDKKASKLHEIGVDILCKDLVSVDMTPEFQGYGNSPKEKFKIFPKVIFKNSVEIVQYYIEKGDYTKAYHEVVELIEQYEKNKNYNCLQRHFLESVGTTLKNTVDEYLDLLNHPDDQKYFHKFLTNFLNKQFFAAKISRYFDKKAGKYQEKGLRIFCQDIPPIPYL